MTSNPEGFSPMDLTYCFQKPECIVTTNPDRSVLITIITWHFLFHPVNVSNLLVKGAYMCSTREPFHAFLPLLRCVVPLNDGNCRLALPVVKGRCDREALPQAFNSGVFKYDKSNSTTVKHTYNESENLNEGCDVAFDSNNLGGMFHRQCQWLAWRVWWRALAFVTHEIIWRWAYVA